MRPARPGEYDEIARLTIEAYREDGQLGAEHGYEQILADVAGRAGHGELLVAVLDSRLVGSVTFVLPGTRYAELSRPGEAEFRMLAVDPAAQGRGVGLALARACVARAREEGCASVVICTRDFAAGALRLYERLGFVRAPELDWMPAPSVQLLGLRLDLRARAER